MSLDHYVPQAYLKNFCLPSRGNQLYAIRKSDLRLFTPRTPAVCAIKNGSVNAYLRKDRAIEEFLREIEPKYGTALDNLIAGSTDSDTVYTISGIIASIMACSPAGMRINSEPFRGMTEAGYTVMDARGALPPVKPQLRCKRDQA